MNTTKFNQVFEEIPNIFITNKGLLKDVLITFYQPWLDFDMVTVSSHIRVGVSHGTIIKVTEEFLARAY